MKTLKIDIEDKYFGRQKLNIEFNDFDEVLSYLKNIEENHDKIYGVVVK